MKHIYILLIFMLGTCHLFSQGIGGVEADVSSDDITLSYTLGSLYSPSTTTIWTDGDGNQVTCSGLCSLSSAFGDDYEIKPGRYCLQVILYDYYDVDEPTAEEGGGCAHEMMSITRCYDIEGSTCGTTGSMSNSGITCISNDQGMATFDGVLADCLAVSPDGNNNAKLTWTTGRTNNSPLADINDFRTIENLTPGKYCVKITPFDSEIVGGETCDCTAYFCTEIGSIEVEPLSIEATVTPMKVCWNGPNGTNEVLSPGSIRIWASGGSTFLTGEYGYEWIGSPPGPRKPYQLQQVPPAGEWAKRQHRYCMAVTDDCGNRLTKCFTIPQVRVPCDEIPPPVPDPNEDDDELGMVVQNGSDMSKIANVNSSTPPLEPENKSIIQSELRVFPNPASLFFNIEVISNELVFTDLKLFNVAGQMVKNKSIHINIGLTFDRLDIDGLKSGIYFLRVGDFEVKKIIVVN